MRHRLNNVVRFPVDYRGRMAPPCIVVPDASLDYWGRQFRRARLHLVMRFDRFIQQKIERRRSLLNAEFQRNTVISGQEVIHASH